MKHGCPPDCPLRKAGCQSKCPEYKAMREELAEYRERNRKVKLVDGYCASTVRRAKAVQQRLNPNMILNNH